jgi:L-ascorbate metabolism protein UlaG (beta-lactamase superfamily)
MTLPDLRMTMNASSSNASPVEVRIHYLGHASFVLQFDNGVNVLTDYGSYNAWAEWGWDSPIHDVGDLVPHVMTYSHTHHTDHCDESRRPDSAPHVLTGVDSLTIKGIEIRPIRTSEGSLDERENTSYLFSYRGLRVLHLGDCQANIVHIADDTNRKYIKEVFADPYDLVLVPIESQEKFIPQVKAFLDLLRPRQVMPMHYWSEAYRDEFLVYLEARNGIGGRRYLIERVQGASHTLSTDDANNEATRVICLERAPLAPPIARDGQ